MKHTFYLLCLLLFACGPTNKLRRAEKLIAAAELQGAKWERDTVVKEVPVYTERIETDTVIYAPLHDTVTIQKDKLVIKYVKLPADSVYIYGKCEADTVYKTVTHTITNTIKTKQWPWWWLIIAAVLGAALAVILKRW